MKKTPIVSIIVAVAVLAAVVVWKVKSTNSAADVKRPNVALVKLEPPARENVRYMLTYTGDVLPMQQAGIFSKVSGNLERVYVNIGDHVRENQLLALIDTTELAQQYRQALATAVNNRLIYQRNKDLAGQNLIARQDLDNTDAAMKIADANLEAAKTRLDYAKIAAPFTGNITKRFLDAGANVTSNNATLFTLMSIETMKIIINVLERDIPQVKAGRKVVVTVDAYPGRQFEGTIVRFSDAVDLSTRTMATEVDVPNAQHLLKPGMYANVTLVIEEHANAITVPTYALLKDDKGQFVYVADGTVARRTPVTIGIEQNSRTEILSGLTGAEQLITTGQQFTRDGGQIKIQ